MVMKSVQLRDAKAGFSALVEAAERGQPTLVTKHGRPAAMIVPIEVGQRAYSSARPSFAEHLLAFPGGIDFERDETPIRDIDL